MMTFETRRRLFQHGSPRAPASPTTSPTVTQVLARVAADETETLCVELPIIGRACTTVEIPTFGDIGGEARDFYLDFTIPFSDNPLCLTTEDDTGSTSPDFTPTSIPPPPKPSPTDSPKGASFGNNYSTRRFLIYLEADFTTTNQEQNPMRTSSSSKDFRAGAGAIPSTKAGTIPSTVLPSQTASPVSAPSDPSHPRVVSDSAPVDSTLMTSNTVSSSLQAQEPSAVTTSQPTTSGDQVAGHSSMNVTKIVIPICVVALIMVLLGAILYWRRKRRSKRPAEAVNTRLQPFTLKANENSGLTAPHDHRTKSGRYADKSLPLTSLTPPPLTNQDIPSRSRSRGSTSRSPRATPRPFTRVTRSDTLTSEESSNETAGQSRERDEIVGEVPHLARQMRFLMQRFEALETAVQGDMTPGVAGARRDLIDGMDLEDRPPDYVSRPMSGEGRRRPHLIPPVHPWVIKTPYAMRDTSDYGPFPLSIMLAIVDASSVRHAPPLHIDYVPTLVPLFRSLQHLTSTLPPPSQVSGDSIHYDGPYLFNVQVTSLDVLEQFKRVKAPLLTIQNS
ncbi:hypothetical protein NP233_g4241 [Leucocoprinus birnbaumii]|uniref:Uncharacterized protein n=1 Tax=Leucocoprinus birnbaumii TaxID=56174 RepID=A0AAD5W1N6_9AGAR|nr:hypothetical protein NP233_g4241 [Leucocoprinus birnbaumii]